MAIFKKIKRSNGYRDVFILGIKILSYKKKTLKDINKPRLDRYCFKKMGVETEIQPGCRIYNTDNISIGTNVKIGQDTLIEGMGGLIIKNND